MVAFCCRVHLLAQFWSDQLHSDSWEINLICIKNMAKAILSANLRSRSVEGSRVADRPSLPCLLAIKILSTVENTGPICTAHVAYGVEAKPLLSGMIWYLGALCSRVLQCRPQSHGLSTAVRMLLPLVRGAQAWIALPALAGGNSRKHAATSRF